MKNAAAPVCAILLILTGCMNQPTEEKRNVDVVIGGLKDRLDYLEKDNRAIKEYLQKMVEPRIANLQGDVEYLRSLVAMRSGTEKPTKEDPAKQQERFVAEKQTEDVATRTASGVASVEDAAKELTPISKYSVPVLVKVLKKLRDNFLIDEPKKIEALIARMPLEDVKASIPDLTKDPYLRLSAASIIEAVGDYELSRSLEPFLAGADEDFRHYSARVMVKCKNRTGLPLLIQALKKNDDGAKLAFIMLEKVTRQNFDYNLHGTLEQNKEAVRRWEEWWEKSGAGFKFE